MVMMNITSRTSSTSMRGVVFNSTIGSGLEVLTGMRMIDPPAFLVIISHNYRRKAILVGANEKGGPRRDRPNRLEAGAS
jgi:hypothetical protein